MIKVGGKQMNFFKRNKGTLIAIAIFLILLIVAVQVFNMFLGNGEKTLYGNRLDGREAVRITTKEMSSIKKSLKDDVKIITVDEQGRILNVVITVKEDTDLDGAKNLATRVLEQLKDKQKEYYDIQVFIDKDAKTDNFPIIGYKHHTKDNFTWTKDR